MGHQQNSFIPLAGFARGCLFRAYFYPLFQVLSTLVEDMARVERIHPYISGNRENHVYHHLLVDDYLLVSKAGLDDYIAFRKILLTYCEMSRQLVVLDKLFITFNSFMP